MQLSCVACVGGLDTGTCAGELWLAVAAVVQSPADSKVLTEQVASVQENKVGGLDCRMSVLLQYK